MADASVAKGSPMTLHAEGESANSADFVQEIRASRLRLLWKATLISIIFLAWVILLLAGSENANLIDLAIPVLCISISSVLTRWLLNHNQYDLATWAYALGLILTISIMTATSINSENSYIPFLGILVMFVLGMLMSVQNTIILLFISYAMMLGMPIVLGGGFELPKSMVFALLLMGLAALLVAQVSGELYGIAEWALASYRKERETATKLHESRQEVEKNLLKQKNLTLQMQELNVEVETARKSAEMAKHFRGIFLANMSHELRTPLNAIIGFSDTMLNFPVMYGDVEMPEDYRADLQQINTSGNHLLNIINDILDLSKIDAGRLEIDFQKVDLVPIFNGVLATAVGLIGGKPIDLVSDLPKEVPPVWGDPLRIRQVIINIYSNAAKFTSEGSITLGFTTQGNDAIISVKDTGPGIESKMLEEIFEAFTQGASGRKQQRQGSGLGLAITRELLGLMNGKVWCESVVGQGSTFFITIPLYKEEFEQQPTAEATAN